MTTRGELLQRVGSAAVLAAVARRALAHSESSGQTMQARKDRAALADAEEALSALVEQAEQQGA